MRIVLIGFGTVGSHLAKILETKRGELVAQHGLNPKLVAAVDRAGAAIDPNGLDVEKILMAKERTGSVSGDPRIGQKGKTAAEVIETVEAEVLIEATPTNFQDGEPGLTHIKSALKKRMNVVTVNKGPLALALPSLLELAAYNGVSLRFSGAVGGGTPILDLARKCILGNKIRSIKAILNGTTNYILTRMTEGQIPMESALKEARTAGYAEADASYDLNGIDTAAKLAIIANWILGINASLRDVKVTGIKEITLEDVKKAAKENLYIKLIGSIDQELAVAPTPIPRSHPLCVNGALNAVMFDTDLSGEITLVGHGAGGPETASAILRDMIDIRSGLAQRA